MNTGKIHFRPCRTWIVVKQMATDFEKRLEQRAFAEILRYRGGALQ